MKMEKKPVLSPFTAFLPESFEKYFAEGRSSGSFSSDAFPLRINATVAKYCQNL